MRRRRLFASGSPSKKPFPVLIRIVIPAALILGIIFYLGGLFPGRSGFLRPVDIELTLAEKAPLSALAEIEAQEPVRVRLEIAGKDGEDLNASFDRLAQSHRLPVLGLYPEHRNRVRFTLTAADGSVYHRSRTIRTTPLPNHYPEVRVERHLPEKISPGMIFLHLAHYDAEGKYRPLPSAVDRYGRVRWYYDGDIGHVLRRLSEGTLLIQEEKRLIEIDMLGRKTGRYISVESGIHHDALVLPNGNFLVLTAAPDSTEDGLVEVDRERNKVIRSWDFRDILDPERPRQPKNLDEKDWLHLNAVTYEPSREEIIVSGRDQSAVVAVDRWNGDLQWILGNHRHWNDEFEPYLFLPLFSEDSKSDRSDKGDETFADKPSSSGGNDVSAAGIPDDAPGDSTDGYKATTNFAWPWGQHAPEVHPDDPSRILIYDNGNKRSYDDPRSPAENYSRAVEYRIDRDSMEIDQLWEYGRRFGSSRYTPFIGDANYLPGGNRLVTFGGITRDLSGKPVEIFDWEEEKVRRMKITVRIEEVTGEMPAREVMSLTFRDSDPESYRGYRCYRAVKMPLYPHETLTFEERSYAEGR